MTILRLQCNNSTISLHEERRPPAVGYEHSIRFPATIFKCFKAVMAGHHHIRGLSNSDIRASLEDSPHLRDLALNPKKQSAKVSRILNRFHAHKLIAKIPRTRRWRVTNRGKQIMAASLCLRDIAFPELFRKNAAA